MAREKEGPSVLGRIAVVAAACALAVALVVGGLYTCCTPVTTAALAQAFSGAGNPDTPFDHNQLVRGAVATRDYTVGTHDREKLESVLTAINEEANTPYADPATATRVRTEIYTLDEDALMHLDDVYATITWAYDVLAGACLASAALFLLVGLTLGKRFVGEALVLAGAAVVVVLAALAIVAVVNFDGLFAGLHALFFADGTWTFSYDSLLITLYPIEFWMGMGAVWLAVSAGLSILAIVTGAYLRRRFA